MKFAAWVEIRERDRKLSERKRQGKRMDQIALDSPDGAKHLLALRLRVEQKPLLHLAVNRTDGRTSQSIDLAPRDAGSLADWILEPMPAGWGFEDILRRVPAAVAPSDQATPPIELNQERAKLVCFVLNVLSWKLPREYGPAWLVGELANAGIPIAWDNDAEHFIPKGL